jgi:phosphoribosylglycinamide formyltransferase-1
VKRVALFASGSGTNVQRIAEYFKDHPAIKVNAVYCNNPDAYVLKRAETLDVTTHVFNREEWKSGKVLRCLQEEKTDFIVLAGFLWLVPSGLLEAYPEKIINIHPSLLPAYGGKGMYGQRVHEAVIANKEKESGITIHLVNEEYDKGRRLFQAQVSIAPGEGARELSEKIHLLEQQHFPRVIEEYILSRP